MMDSLPQKTRRALLVGGHLLQFAFHTLVAKPAVAGAAEGVQEALDVLVGLGWSAAAGQGGSDFLGGRFVLSGKLDGVGCM